MVGVHARDSMSETARVHDVAALSDVDLGALLERLEREEQKASKRRGSLHNRIEFVQAGGAASEDLADDQLASLRETERELSDRRLVLHRQIDELCAERSRRLALASRL